MTWAIHQKIGFQWEEAHEWWKQCKPPKHTQQVFHDASSPCRFCPWTLWLWGSNPSWTERCWFRPDDQSECGHIWDEERIHETLFTDFTKLLLTYIWRIDAKWWRLADLPEATSHTATVWSKEPVSSRSPSVLKHRERTSPVWPWVRTENDHPYLTFTTT